MGEKFLKLTGMSVGAFLAMLLAVNWQEILPAGEWVVNQLDQATKELPGGKLGPVLALLFGMAAWAVAVIHKEIFKSRPQTWGDLCALGTGIGVMYVIYQTLGDGTSKQLGLSFLFGWGMGLTAILGARLGWNMVAKPKEAPKGDGNVSG